MGRRGASDSCFGHGSVRRTCRKFFSFVCPLTRRNRSGGRGLSASEMRGKSRCPVQKQHIYRVKLLALFSGNCWHICSSLVRICWLCEKGEVNCAGVPVVLRGAEESYPAGAIHLRVESFLVRDRKAESFRAFRFFFWL